MTRYSFILFIVCIFMVACSPRRAKNIPTAEYVPTLPSATFDNPDFQLPEIPATPARLVLRMERKSCFIGKCPAFLIEFYSDGVVNYDGKSYVDLYGKYTSKISKEELNTLLTLARNNGYMDFANIYPTTGKIIMDVPLTISYVKADLEENYIENHHHAPVQLVRFEEHIEGLIENLNWQKADVL